MTDEIRQGDYSKQNPEIEQWSRLVPMTVGEATVYVEQVGDLIVEGDASIRPVAPPSPQEIFETTSNILSECVRVIGERLKSLSGKAAPEKVTVEFSLTFKIQGKASIIPVFVTSESGAETGVKVTAEWDRSENHESASHDNRTS